MKKQINTTVFNGVTIKAENKGLKVAPWQDESDSAIRHHVITLALGDNAARFDFWTSIAHPKMTKGDDLLGAYSCILMDACTGDQCADADEIMEEFGSSLEDGIKVNTGCKDTLAKVGRVIGEDWRDHLEELNEKGL